MIGREGAGLPAGAQARPNGEAHGGVVLRVFEGFVSTRGEDVVEHVVEEFVGSVSDGGEDAGREHAVVVVGSSIAEGGDEGIGGSALSEDARQVVPAELVGAPARMREGEADPQVGDGRVIGAGEQGVAGDVLAVAAGLVPVEAVLSEGDEHGLDTDQRLKSGWAAVVEEDAQRPGGCAVVPALRARVAERGAGLVAEVRGEWGAVEVLQEGGGEVIAAQVRDAADCAEEGIGEGPLAAIRVAMARAVGGGEGVEGGVDGVGGGAEREQKNAGIEAVVGVVRRAAGGERSEEFVNSEGACFGDRIAESKRVDGLRQGAPGVADASIEDATADG
jgi:hypothetical protein